MLRTTFDPSSQSIVDARAVSGPAEGILDDDRNGFSRLGLARQFRLKLLHCMYTIVRILHNYCKIKSLRPASQSGWHSCQDCIRTSVAFPPYNCLIVLVLLELIFCGG